jgi:hypothetical protein
VMMADVLTAFQERLRSRFRSVDDLDATSAVEVMLAFYTSDRAHDTDAESDGDMLLFQWGTHDWGSGPAFRYDITRQLITAPGGDEAIWQLSLTLDYLTDGHNAQLASGHRWHAAPEHLAEFAGYIAGHPATIYAAARQPLTVRLSWEQV